MPDSSLDIDVEAMSAHADEAASLLRALSNKSRLMILCLLSERECSVGELLKQVPLGQSALSQHLAVLRRDGLVGTRRQSQTIFYSLADPKAREVIRLLHQMYCMA
ncbi:MAG: metalloregulator ArsR/SmtB family transcription factor [Proteobacteria bacterium]|nr:metalloregulator ArsR/SmtB family transcription factor [Pseudomonadota bacterium]